ncbi:homocysteine-responsive endoplasmic reticulum-resident ubiquitin-like domain member 2 protein [Melitaea cinxia]|uniref:homocysteine-responsive endoplasmic reticulum-resident ubiquitin-like domain member 2 protein n=1 Tax=Melitaea cinxia TaxID=113334 RepID=UPI001E27113E|nr:homocysteine-responsive endoplasmic reticulum-resident ubiquitin-like domain member 2 protein [Melitaea cinxia]
MIPDNVTLIVKAPNQQIEDQNIECQSSWTVRQLKGHLSEVYPSKPRADEQKIIYSGQLLEDNTILKDVLRNYESQIAHTMHLVCSSKRMQENTQELPKTDGLRQRNVPENTPRPTETTPRPEMRQNDQNHTVEMQNYLSSFVNNYGRVPPYPNYNFGEGYLPIPNDPASMANHMLMVQQAYMQYMQQYANMRQAMTDETPTPPTETPAPQPQAPEPEQEEGARDWLDHLYAASRFAILLSLFCLYGSPARLLLVVILAAAGYLHQIGFFRVLNVNPLNNGRRNEQQNNENRPQNNDNQQQNNDNQQQNNDNQRQPNDQQNNDDDNQQSLLAVTWMIFTSFFASLIPDTN